jgi:hypothetical protein
MGSDSLFSMVIEAVLHLREIEMQRVELLEQLQTLSQKETFWRAEFLLRSQRLEGIAAENPTDPKHSAISS